MSSDETTTIGALHNAARDWAARGIPVFPCLPGEKAPAVSGGFKAATTDAATIDGWWADNAAYNVGVYPHGAGFGVVDLDGAEAGETTWADLCGTHDIGDGPTTLTIRTPSGGRHLWFKGELPSTVQRLGAKVDTRGKGGYVLVPPSATPAGPYRVERDAPVADLPAWVTLLLARTSKAADQPSARQGEPVSEATLRDMLAHIDPAGRDQWRDTLAGLRAGPPILDEAGAELSQAAMLTLADEWSAGAYWPDGPPASYQGTDDVENAWYSLDPGKEGGVKFGTVVHLAQQGGWNAQPRTPDPSPAWAEALAEIVREEGAVAKVRRDHTYPLLTLAQIRERKPLSFHVPRILPEAALVDIFGFPEAGKTWWGLDMALHLATGCQGNYPRPDVGSKSVLYYAGEGATTLAKVRVQAWCDKHGFDPNDPDAVRLLVLEQPPRLSTDAEADVFMAALRDQGADPDLFFLDTFARVLSAAGLEETTTDIGLFVAQADRIKAAFGCTVVLLHHTPVDSDLRPRGGGALNAAIAAEFRARGNITRQTVNAGTAYFYAQCTKMQDAEKDETPISFRAVRSGSGLVLEPITPEELKDLMKRAKGGVDGADVLRYQVLRGLDAQFKAGATEVTLAHLATEWIKLDEGDKVAAGGYVRRTDAQMEAAAKNWRDRDLKPAVVNGAFDDLLVMEAGEVKRGKRGSMLLRATALDVDEIGLDEADE